MRAARDVTTLNGMLLNRGDGMWALSGQKELNSVATQADGLAGWLLGVVRGFRGTREMQRKQLRLLETLSLGGKRHLMLVSCAGESFLVGGGMDSVETIVRLRAEVSLDDVVKSVDGTCQ